MHSLTAVLIFCLKSNPLVCKKSDFATLNVHLISPAGRWKFHFDSSPKLACDSMNVTLHISDSALFEICISYWCEYLTKEIILLGSREHISYRHQKENIGGLMP